MNHGLVYRQRGIACRDGVKAKGAHARSPVAVMFFL
jgi:hypothetical protein